MRGFVPARRVPFVSAKMVLGPFAETKGPCLQGRNPASNNFPTDLVFHDPKAFLIERENCLVDGSGLAFLVCFTIGISSDFF